MSWTKLWGFSGNIYRMLAHSGKSALAAVFFFFFSITNNQSWIIAVISTLIKKNKWNYHFGHNRAALLQMQPHWVWMLFFFFLGWLPWWVWLKGWPVGGVINQDLISNAPKLPVCLDTSLTAPLSTGRSEQNLKYVVFAVLVSLIYSSSTTLHTVIRSNWLSIPYTTIYSMTTNLLFFFLL